MCPEENDLNSCVRKNAIFLENQAGQEYSNDITYDFASKVILFGATVIVIQKYFFLVQNEK